ncbi:MAG TPA: hypothetical protein VFM43_04385 [Gaiellaceae bacterium]|nr:hypothetical protein [Gaiellaceae bacterium]
MRPRSANEWRDFWRDGGERALHEQLDEFAPHSVRIAALLGSNAPERALVAELGRIREHELGGPAAPERDAEVAERVYVWFESVALARSNASRTSDSSSSISDVWRNVAQTNSRDPQRRT